MVSNGSFGQYEDCDGDETLPVPVEARQDAPISVRYLDGYHTHSVPPTAQSMEGGTIGLRSKVDPEHTICQEPELILRHSRRPPWRLQRQGNRHLRAGERVLPHPDLMEHYWPRRQR
jgi:hypothetical protein